MIPFIKLAEFQALRPNMDTGEGKSRLKIELDPHAKFSTPMFALTSNSVVTRANQNS